MTETSTQTYSPWRVSIAPMMDWTDRHYRYLMRLMSRHTLLYTEMVTTGALIHGDTDRFLKYSQSEHPIALQLGGSNPKDLAHCAGLAQDRGFDEVNLNVGCPSERVQSGSFGACLMKEGDLLAECISAMKNNCNIPVTVKTRIGVDEYDSYEFLHGLIHKLYQAGCRVFIMHARKAWLKGLNPKQNREVPPLQYDTVKKLKQDFPDSTIVLNGGLKDFDQMQSQLKIFDGVMIGRQAYYEPYLFAEVDNVFFGENNPVKSRLEILKNYLPYVKAELENGTKLNAMSRHVLNMFNGVSGAKAFRRHISENAHKAGSGISVVEDALAYI